MKMIDIQKKLDVKNIHHLVDREIKGKFKTNNLTDEQVKTYKLPGSELIQFYVCPWKYYNTCINALWNTRIT